MMVVGIEEHEHDKKTRKKDAHEEELGYMRRELSCVFAQEDLARRKSPLRQSPEIAWLKKNKKKSLREICRSSTGYSQLPQVI